MKYTETLARWAAETDGLEPGGDLAAIAAELLLDWCGAALGGSAHPMAAMIDAIVRENSPAAGPSTVLSASMETTTSPLWAAFRNGFNGHILEMDDVHRGSVIHPGAVVIPAALAVGQALGASGVELLTAIAVGYEVAIRVGLAAGASHYRKWHTTGTCGTFGAAAAAGRLIGLTPERMAWALGNAGSQAAGLWQFLDDGAMTKPLHPAKAAMNGLLSALAARDGFSGPNSILEGNRGFLSATSTDVSLHKLTEGLGDGWALAEVSVKPYASCRHSHPQIDVALQMRAEHKFAAEDIRAVRVETYQTAINVAGGSGAYPVQSHEAKFDSPYCVALALLKGRVDMSDFEPVRIADADDVRRLRGKVAVVASPGFEAQYPDKWGARIEVLLADGRTLNATTMYAYGDPEKPMLRADIVAKFRDMAGGALEAGALEEFAERVLAVGDAADVNSVFGAGRPGA